MTLNSSDIAKVFAAAKDAPTSFESEEWLGGFEFARQTLACRLAVRLLPMPEQEAFMDACGVPEDA